MITNWQGIDTEAGYLTSVTISMSDIKVLFFR